MLQTEKLGKKSFMFAVIGLLSFLAAIVQRADAAESGCVTCHLDKEKLQKNIAVQKGQKSAMQSGAG